MSARLDPATLKVFDRVIATFQPREDDLNSEAFGAIGWRGEWLAAWKIEGEGNRNAGEWAMQPVGRFLGFAWAPSSDLVDVEPMVAPAKTMALPFRKSKI